MSAREATRIAFFLLFHKHITFHIDKGPRSGAVSDLVGDGVNFMGTMLCSELATTFSAKEFSMCGQARLDVGWGRGKVA